MNAPTTATDKKVVVLDTSAFVAGFDPFSIEGELFTSPAVKEEIVENSMSGVRFRTAVESGKLKVKMPSEAFIDRTKSSATVIGDKHLLSETDIQVLALALELRTRGSSPLIVTDDYSMQNVANQIGIEFASLATFGIRLRLQWLRYCPACYRRYPTDSKTGICEICGTKLKRKPLKKYRLNLNCPTNISNEGLERRKQKH